MTEIRKPKISQSHFGLAQHKLLSFVAEPRYGETIEQVMDEGYFGHVAATFKVPTVIEVIPEGCTYYAKLLVIDCGPVHARTKLLEYVDLLKKTIDTQQTEIRAESKVGAYTAQRYGRWFRVIRNSDKEVIKAALPTMADAEAWIAGMGEARVEG